METFSHDVTFHDLRDVFALMDRCNCGKVSTVELKQLLNSQRCYPNEAELGEIIAEMDNDRDGEISFEDFATYWSKRRSCFAIVSDREIKHVFDFLDHNGDGYVSAADVRKIMHAIGQDVEEEQAEEMLAEVDKCGSGRISYECFKNMMLEDDFCTTMMSGC